LPGISTPQSQAGIFNFYDSPDEGPDIDAKVFIAMIVVFAVVILLLDHFAAF